MKKDMDCIQFESRWEIEEVVSALEEWQDSHNPDSKKETVQKLISLLDMMHMEW